VLDHVQDPALTTVQCIDADILAVEDLADPPAHEVDGRLVLQLARHRQLDLVDHAQLRAALFGLLQQLLRPVKQPRVLQRGACACRERFEQRLVRRRKRLLAIGVHADHADTVAAGADWYAKVAAVSVLTAVGADVAAAEFQCQPGRVTVQQQCRARLYDPAG
jgi:hypothetical protein